MKNYYLILGVERDATQEEIRSAYRGLAKELHPDYYGDDSGPFMDLQEAYGVLNDPARRRAYDRVASNRAHVQSAPKPSTPEPIRPHRPQPEPLIPEQHPIDLDELSLSHSFQTYSPSFEEIFDHLWQNFDRVQPKIQNLESLNVEILLTPWEAYHGGRVKILVPARLKCPICHGYGNIGFFECRHCAGTGIIEDEYPVSIAFPPGIPNNYITRLPLDQLGIHNLYLTVHFKISTAA